MLEMIITRDDQDRDTYGGGQKEREEPQNETPGRNWRTGGRLKNSMLEMIRRTQKRRDNEEYVQKGHRKNKRNRRNKSQKDQADRELKQLDVRNHSERMS